MDATYQIESLLGTGGFGAVYLARQLSMDREVALKILVANAMNVEEMILRFRREVMACRSLGHPNTIRIYDFRDRPDGILYYTMEYVKGPTLKDVIKNDGPLPPARVAHIVKQVCKSLAEAHSFGIVHRDLKPANIMLAEIAGETDFVKVVDFGIAKIMDGDDGEDRDQLTNAGVLVGTLNYMSPEQIQGGEIGPVSDLYALGLIAIEMLMGRSVFEGTGRWEVLHKQISDDPVEIPPEILGSAIGPVLQKALQKPSHLRYEKAEAMLHALTELSGLSNEPVIELLEIEQVTPVAPSRSASMPMPPPVPVESEPPLPEPMRAPLRTRSVSGAAPTGMPESPVDKSDGFSEEATTLHDSGVSPNPLPPATSPVTPPVTPPAPALEPAEAQMPVGRTMPRQPQVTPMPGQTAFVPGGDTDIGPAPSGNKTLIMIAGVIIVLIGIAAFAVAQLSPDEPAETPPDTPVVAVVPQEPPPEVVDPVEPDPVVEEVAEVPVDIPMKTVRVLTPGVKARLFEGDELVGSTPLRFPVGAKKTYTLRADGYDEQQVELSNGSDDNVNVEMIRTSSGTQAASGTKSDTPTKTTKTTKTPVAKVKPPAKFDWVDVKKDKKKDTKKDTKKEPVVPVF